MVVPFFDLKRQYSQIKKEVISRIGGVLEVGEYCFGKETTEFEINIAKRVGCKYAIATASGTDALIAGLKAVGVGEKDEVITTPATFIATVEAIVWVGAKPVLVDIDPDNWNIDITKISKAISGRTRVVLPVHLYGVCCETDKIRKLIAGRQISVTEDASHAIGSSLGGTAAGALGDVGCFSLYPSKTLGTYGNAGVVTTNDEAIAHEVKKVVNHGRGEDKNRHERIGLTATINNLQAAVLNVKMKHLDSVIGRRKEIAKRYRDALSGLPIKLQSEPDGADTCNYVFSVMTDRRAELKDYLQQNGIGTGIYYTQPVHLQPSMARFGYRRDDFPIAEELFSKVLSLPFFPELTDDEMELVIQAVREFFR